MRGNIFSKSILTICLVIILFYISSCSNDLVKDIPVNHPLPKNGVGGKTLSILTFNIKAIFGKDSSKLDGLIDYIIDQKIDFISLQEIFDEETRNYLLANTDSSFYTSFIPAVNYSSFPELIFEDAGLLIKSSYPQISLDNFRFANTIEHSYGAVHKVLNKELSISTDFLANKSVVGSLHQIDDSTKLFICTTHLQAIGSGFQKRTQLRQIRRFIENSVYTILKNDLVNKPENLIVLLTGDFNADAYNTSHKNMLNRFLGNPRDLHSEFHNGSEEFTMYIPFFNRAIRFDYIFAYDSVGPINLRKIKTNLINVTEIQGTDKTRISDHYALMASLYYE